MRTRTFSRPGRRTANASRSRPIDSRPTCRRCATARTASDCSTPATARDRRPAPSVAGINHLDPEWGGDGSLFFVGDPDGVPNVFRLDLASAGASQVTNVTTGRGRRHPGQSRAVGGRATPARLRSACSATAATRCTASTRRAPVEARGDRSTRHPRGPPWPLAAMDARHRPGAAAARDRARSAPEALSPAAVARRHRVAVPFGRRRTARQLRVGRRLVAVRRSARRPSAADRRSHQQQAGRVGGRRDVRQPRARAGTGA